MVLQKQSDIIYVLWGDMDVEEEDLGDKEMKMKILVMRRCGR